MEPERFKVKDVFDGIIIPLILVLLIFVIAVYVNITGTYHILGNTTDLGSTVAVILSQGFPQMIISGIPLAVGLLWNKWAGGAAGFIMGGMFYVASAGHFNGVYAASGVTTYNFYGDISMLFYLVNAVIIGYIAGSLNNRSTNFKRMLGAGLTAAILTQVIQVYLNYNYSLPPARSMAQGLWTDIPYALLLSFVPTILLGVIVPIIAKVMTWYGIQPLRH